MGGMVAHTNTQKHTHASGTRLGRQLAMAPTNSEEFVVIATVKWDDFTVSRNVSWPPCRYGNITRRRKKRYREREHQSHLCIPVDSYKEQCHYNALSSYSRQTHIHTHTPWWACHTCINTLMQRDTRTLKSLSNTLSTLPMPLIMCSLFSAMALSSRGQFEFIMLNVNIGATTTYLRQVQLVEWACALSDSVRSEKRRGSEIKDM